MIVPDLLTLVVLGLATYRLTAFLTDDTLTEEWRQFVYRVCWVSDMQAPEPRPRSALLAYLGTLLTCAQCLGVWIGALVYLWWDHWHSARWVLTIAALIGVQSLAASVAARLKEPAQ